MNKANKAQIIIIVAAIISGIGLGLVKKGGIRLKSLKLPNFTGELQNLTKTKDFQNDPPESTEAQATTETSPSSPLADKDVINILLLGIDRRSKQETTFNTDTMILLSANIKDNVVLFTSVPRDLWINGNKINALYSVKGEEVLIDAFEKIVGMEIDGYIRCDFEDFRWLVDGFGGIHVEVERSFSDSSFPLIDDSGIQQVSFEKGIEKMDGERALTFARSRKGNNGEGSDLMRAKRQHKILMGIMEGITQPESTFWPIFQPMDIDSFYKLVTARMYTTLSLTDVRYLWDFHKDRNLYNIVSFVVGGDYVYHPGRYPQSEYRAWVFVPVEEGFANLHRDIQKMLETGKNIEEIKAQEASETSQTTQETQTTDINNQ